jgi:hypothetical protein
MLRFRSAVVVFLFAACIAFAAEVPLTTVHGVIEKADKDTLVVQPRDASGKFGKGLNLKITGTSKITIVGTREQGGKTVVTQRDTDAKDLHAKQHVSVIYTTVKDEHILLVAVVAPASEK